MLLLERDRPLALLTDGLVAARRGDGRAILVGGEAGVGKTSLLERFAAQCGAARVLWGACEALSTPHPLGPLYDIARGSRGPISTMLSEAAPLPRLFAGVLDELAAPPAPVLLVIEDLHWADAATLDLVRFLARRIHRVPALVVVSYRDDELDATPLLRSIFGELPPRHVTRVALEPLSSAGVAALAAEADRDATGVHAATGGNPFFVTEVLAHAGAAVPATVRDAVLARAARLPRTAHDVLELVAIVPRSTDLSLVEALIEDAADGIDACIAGGLLIAERGGLRFRHELARGSIEASLPPARARALHQRVLAALADPSDGRTALAHRVHHAQRADDRVAVLALAPLAAREAASRGARREAAAHCRAALAMADAMPDAMRDADRAELLESYAGLCFELNELASAIPAREEAIALFEKTGDRRRSCAALAAHAMPLVRALRNADADAASRRALDIAESLPAGPERAAAYATEARLRMLNRDYRDAIAWGERAIATADEFGTRATLAAAYNSVGAALMFVDEPRGVEAVMTSLDIARSLPDGAAAIADAYVMLGTASGELHRFAAAERHLEDGIAFARAHDLDRLGGYMEAWQALVDVHRGRWTLAGERAHGLIAREVAGSTNRVMALVALGRLRTRRGDPGGDAALDEALALADRSGTLQRIAPVRAARAEAAWLRDDADAVRREVDAAFDLAEAKSHPWFVGELAYWRARIGELASRPSVAAEPYALEIDGRWREAADAWAALGCPYEEARALASGDEPARLRALALFDRLGAAPMARRIRHDLRRSGAQSVPRGPHPSTRANDAGLTARELQILAMVADGWTNARIATRLSRSTRTVEHHIASILTKLGVARRGDAAAVARARGLLAKDG